MDRMRQFLTILLFGFALTGFGAVVPKNEQPLELKAGWNLVALEGTPLLPQKELLPLKPLVFDKESQSYVRYVEGMELERGQAVWLYSEEAQSIELALVSTDAAQTSEAQPDGDPWSMIGAASDTPSWLEDVIQPFFRWDAQQGFAPTNDVVKGQGYWVRLK